MLVKKHPTEEEKYFAFVCFEKQEEAQKVFEELNGKDIFRKAAI